MHLDPTAMVSKLQINALEYMSRQGVTELPKPHAVLVDSKSSLSVQAEILRHHVIIRKKT